MVFYVVFYVLSCPPHERAAKGIKMSVLVEVYAMTVNATHKENMNG